MKAPENRAIHMRVINHFSQNDVLQDMKNGQQKQALDKVIIMNQQLPSIYTQHRPSLFGNAVLQQNLMTSENSLNQSEIVQE